MVDRWGRFGKGAGRHLSALGWDQNLNVYEPTESYSAGEGYDISYPGSPTDTVDAEITMPDASGDVDPGGTTVDADVVIRVTDDTGVSWREFGESGEAATRVEDTSTGVRYEIETVVSEHNGLLMLAANEV